VRTVANAHLHEFCEVEVITVRVELHLAGRPVKSLVADVYKENSYPREARK